LRRAEVFENPPRLVHRAEGKKPAGGFDQIARPDEVVPAEILVALRLA
jgi:hypothetical protein